MSYDEEQAKTSRVVVQTPTARREVVSSESVRSPNGVSGAMVGVLVVVAIALITIMVLFWMSTQPTNDPNLAAQQAAQQAAPPPTTIVQQPAPVQQPPVIIQQPAPVTQPAPIIVTQPAGGATEANANDDTTVQAAIDKQIADDATFAPLGITATVINGKVTLMGTVQTQALKSQAERMIMRIKVVKSVDTQIIVGSE